MKRLNLINTLLLISCCMVYGNHWETINEKTWMAKKDFPINQYVSYAENCGSDNNPILTEIEAIFLNAYIEIPAQHKNFNFIGKKIAFVTGSSGSRLGSKIEYFDNVRKWKENYDSKIATSIIVINEIDKLEYGYDAIVTYWVKVLTPRATKKLLDKTKEKN